MGLGWALYYYFACESGAGQTLGKRVMKIRVVGMDGAPAGMREIALRTVLRVVDGLFLYLVGLIVMIATGERRGRLGDLVGDTMIVSADEPAPSAAGRAEALAAPEADRRVGRRVRAGAESARSRARARGRAGGRAEQRPRARGAACAVAQRSPASDVEPP